MPEVSRVRLKQTLFAEYPGLRDRIEQLAGQKTEQYPGSLARIWKVSDEDAEKIAMKLVEVVFFELKGALLNEYGE